MVSPCAYVRFKTAAMRAIRILILYGFVIKSSPPKVILQSSSISVLRLVTKMIGTPEKERICLHNTKPSVWGRLISNRIQCGSSRCNNNCISSIKFHTQQAYPCRRKTSDNSFTIVSSSSMSNILYMALFPFLLLLVLTHYTRKKKMTAVIFQYCKNYSYISLTLCNNKEMPLANQESTVQIQVETRAPNVSR